MTALPLPARGRRGALRAPRQPEPGEPEPVSWGKPAGRIGLPHGGEGGAAGRAAQRSAGRGLGEAPPSALRHWREGREGGRESAAAAGRRRGGPGPVRRPSGPGP